MSVSSVSPKTLKSRWRDSLRANGSTCMIQPYDKRAYTTQVPFSLGVIAFSQSVTPCWATCGHGKSNATRPCSIPSVYGVLSRCDSRPSDGCSSCCRPKNPHEETLHVSFVKVAYAFEVFFFPSRGLADPSPSFPYGPPYSYMMTAIVRMMVRSPVGSGSAKAQYVAPPTTLTMSRTEVANIQYTFAFSSFLTLVHRVRMYHNMYCSVLCS
jgi:hypothetical protein